MKHYTAEQWVDFVNGAATQAVRTEMQDHLDTRCKECNKAAALWQKVRQFAAAERNYQPPADAVGVVKAAFIGTEMERKAGWGETLVELLFDSFRQPMTAGARSGNAASRQMLFRANPYQIDVTIEAKPDARELLVTGQVLDVSQPDSAARGIPVTLSNRCGQTVQIVTNDFGEFCGELENRGDLELSFLGLNDKPIVVSLADALGQLPPSARGTSKRPLRH